MRKELFKNTVKGLGFRVLGFRLMVRGYNGQEMGTRAIKLKYNGSKLLQLYHGAESSQRWR